MNPALDSIDGAANPRRRAFTRVLRHMLGLIGAGLVTWLVIRGYQDPALMLEFANLRLC